MKPIRIYRHDEPVGAGYLLDYLSQHNFDFELVTIDQGGPVTFDIENASGLVFLGGDASVNDAHRWIEDELRLIQLADEKNFPVFGHCFGAQLISKALGCSIAPMASKEIGWYALNWVQNEITHKWFASLKSEVEKQEIHALHWHKYSLSIPSGATPLFGTDFCPRQAFVKDNMIATTAHVEATVEMLKTWTIEYAEDLVPSSNTVQSELEILSNVNDRVENMQVITNILYQQWINMVNAMSD